MNLKSLKDVGINLLEKPKELTISRWTQWKKTEEGQENNVVKIGQNFIINKDLDPKKINNCIM